MKENDLSDAAMLNELLRAQRAAHRQVPYPAWEKRAEHLSALRAMLLDHRDALAHAISADFGQRAKAEVLLSELWLLKKEIDTALRYGRRWMKPMRRATGIWLLPARAHILPQPLGVVGIVAPWNYPLLLAIGPLVGALAAGNRAMIKMSELTPNTAELIKRLIAQTFAHDQVAVVTGDASFGAAFSALPFDHLLFTGSTAVGRQVMRSAANHLTSVTLELGGKSPAIVGLHAQFDAAVDSIVAGKTLNAGQTCIAPDYALVPRGTEAAFIARARRQMARLYPDFARNRDYTTIITDQHWARLVRLAEDAAAAGAQLHPLIDVSTRNQGAAEASASAPRSGDVEGAPSRNGASQASPASRRFVPSIVTDAPADCALMREEIFGPLLPLVPYDTLDEAIRYVNARERPLALYLFENDPASVERVLRETVSGGVAINETLLHVACTGLPFGGVGASGMGAYHGYEGFMTFSQMKPVFTQARWNARGWLLPPYGRRFKAIVSLMLKA
ncbi:MAG TPA: coniferyl aldehyde dehydrogenase [Trinickia sp.]|jgi:coniferyl-aldehyde dehydrogenase|uniref:coniferyl aldehyde dehydrogenase n=1 Tax=Trinickia sp. TaxID=2571163 RepID=UPI002B53A66F|nr:coniferyl aldehyde dehydrogenase [Trinickia sp.]HTI18166.1 coniferyl aldehyde dehydrogenase [Trinickia sp.]